MHQSIKGISIEAIAACVPKQIIDNSQFEDLLSSKEIRKFEKIKKFTLLPKEFSIEAGEITATLKLKRKVIQKKYKELIDKMYKD